MKYWNEQLQWSSRQSTSPDVGLLSSQDQMDPILNIHAYNTLIKAFSGIPRSWEESLQCCNRIEEIISQNMNTVAPDDISRSIAINAWSKCAGSANHDLTKKKFCADKACTHLDFMLLDSSRTQSPTDITNDGDFNNNFSSRVLHSLNHVMTLCGESYMPKEANELFLRAKECNLCNLSTISATVEALAQSKDVIYVEKAMGYILELERDMGLKRFANNISSKRHDYTRMYNACIDGFISVGQRDKAHNILLRAIKRQSENPMHIWRPNSTSFALVMDALAQQGRFNEIESLLTTMEQMKQERNTSRDENMDNSVEPNIIHYNTLMTSYVRSKHESALEYAQKLFNRMKNDQSLPSPDTVTNALMLQLQNKSSSKEDSQADQANINTASLIGSNISSINLDTILETLDQTESQTSQPFSAIMKAFANSTIEGAESGTFSPAVNFFFPTIVLTKYLRSS
jgi:hypothetical protein